MNTKFLSAPVRKLEQGIVTVKVAELDGAQADRVGDVYAQESFDKTIAEFEEGQNPIALLFNHDYARPVGRINKFWKEGTDLMMEAEINQDIEDGKMIKSMIEQGTIKNTSIGYQINDEQYDRSNSKNILLDITLLEISFVAVPADPKAQIVDTKSITELSIKDASHALRGAGFTKRKTDFILMNGFNATEKSVQDEAHDLKMKYSHSYRKDHEKAESEKAMLERDIQKLSKLFGCRFG